MTLNTSRFIHACTVGSARCVEAGYLHTVLTKSTAFRLVSPAADSNVEHSSICIILIGVFLTYNAVPSRVENTKLAKRTRCLLTTRTDILGVVLQTLSFFLHFHAPGGTSGASDTASASVPPTLLSFFSLHTPHVFTLLCLKQCIVTSFHFFGSASQHHLFLGQYGA